MFKLTFAIIRLFPSKVMKYLLAFLEVESFGLFTILFCVALIPERDLSKRVEMDRVEEDMMISSSFVPLSQNKGTLRFLL